MNSFWNISILFFVYCLHSTQNKKDGQQTIPVLFLSLYSFFVFCFDVILFRSELIHRISPKSLQCIIYRYWYKILMYIHKDVFFLLFYIDKYIFSAIGRYTTWSSGAFGCFKTCYERFALLFLIQWTGESEGLILSYHVYSWTRHN